MRLARNAHQPKVLAGSLQKRMQKNRPSILVGKLDERSEMSELDKKPPNLVIQPMASQSSYDELNPLASYHDEKIKLSSKRSTSRPHNDTIQS